MSLSSIMPTVKNGCDEGRRFDWRCSICGFVYRYYTPEEVVPNETIYLKYVCCKCREKTKNIRERQGIATILDCIDYHGNLLKQVYLF